MPPWFTADLMARVAHRCGALVQQFAQHAALVVGRAAHDEILGGLAPIFFEPILADPVPLFPDFFSIPDQFIKHVDEHGHVTYSQEPGYDYSQDEPSVENQRINEVQLKQLRAFIEYRATLPKQQSRAPKMTIRTGRAVCKKRISLLRPGIPDC